MSNLAGKVVLITGASAGIGRELARQLAAKRTRLVLAARRIDRLAEIARQCHEAGAEAIAVPADVTDPAQCERMVQAAIEGFGRLDVLVNNAGRAMWSTFEDLHDLSTIEDVIRLNFFGVVYATKAALPHLQRSRGQIVALSSVSGLTGVPLLSGYSASKHAVNGFCESLRVELRHANVGVTVVAPDFVQSEILERASGPSGDAVGVSPLDQNPLMSTERCARRIVRAIERRERLVLMSLRSKALRWGKLLCPGLVDFLVARAVDFK